MLKSELQSTLDGIQTTEVSAVSLFGIDQLIAELEDHGYSVAENEANEEEQEEENEEENEDGLDESLEDDNNGEETQKLDPVAEHSAESTHHTAESATPVQPTTFPGVTSSTK